MIRGGACVSSGRSDLADYMTNQASAKVLVPMQSVYFIRCSSVLCSRLVQLQVGS